MDATVQHDFRKLTDKAAGCAQLLCAVYAHWLLLPKVANNIGAVQRSMTAQKVLFTAKLPRSSWEAIKHLNKARALTGQQSPWSARRDWHEMVLGFASFFITL